MSCRGEAGAGGAAVLVDVNDTDVIDDLPDPRRIGTLDAHFDLSVGDADEVLDGSVGRPEQALEAGVAVNKERALRRLRAMVCFRLICQAQPHDVQRRLRCVRLAASEEAAVIDRAVNVHSVTAGMRSTRSEVLELPTRGDQHFHAVVVDGLHPCRYRPWTGSGHRLGLPVRRRGPAERQSRPANDEADYDRACYPLCPTPGSPAAKAVQGRCRHRPRQMICFVPEPLFDGHE